MTHNHLIRIHWGYWLPYANKAIHHVDYCWDGYLSIDGGRIHEPELIEFNGVFGPCRETFTPLPKPQWTWSAPGPNRRLGGIRCQIEGDEHTMVHFHSRTADMSFRLGDLLDQGAIRQHIGSRYSCTELCAEVDSRDPNLDTPDDLARLRQEDGRQRRLIHAPDFGAPVRRLYRTDWVWLAPEENLEINLDEPTWGTGDNGACVLRIAFSCIATQSNSGALTPETTDPAMSITEDCNRPRPRGSEICTNLTPETITEDNCNGNINVPYRILFNGAKLVEAERYMPHHGNPLIEELEADIGREAFRPDGNTLQLTNDGKEGYLLVSRLHLTEVVTNFIEIIACPKHVGLGETFEVRIQCRGAVDELLIEAPDGVPLLDDMPGNLDAGMYTFRFRADQPLTDAVIRFRAADDQGEVRIEQITAIEHQDPPMRVGIETSILIPRVEGLTEGVLRLMKETQMGDYAIFRRGEEEEQIARWGRLCRELGIYHFLQHELGIVGWSNVMQHEAGEYYLGHLFLEWDGPIAGWLRDGVETSFPVGQRTMKTAWEDYVAYLSRVVEPIREINPHATIAGNFFVGGLDRACRAGFEIGLAELNKSHNTLLLVDARGAAKANGKPVWGAYIAEGAHKHPEGDDILRMYWLGLHLSYICGAHMINEEETAFRNYHARLYGFHDRVPRLRRSIMRRFNRLTKTHPRDGILKIRQAVLVGQYACDIADGLAEYPNALPPIVWHFFGDDSKAWELSTAEYGMRYLDVFLPGVWLQSLEQSPEQLRRWYAGSPYGEIDVIPADAPADVLSQFDLLLLLGWNTMDQAIYDGLKQYVEGGGRLFMSVPQLSPEESRHFLDEMDGFDLLQGGDFSDLFGVQVTGRGEKLRHIQTTKNGDLGLRPEYSVNPGGDQLNRANAVGPIHPAVHLAQTELRGADVLAQETETGSPVLVRYRLGKGETYLLLTHDFPGNSWLSVFVTDVVRGLAESVRRAAPIDLEDPSGDVYYTVREDKERQLTRLHLLNTDWSVPGNDRPCTLRIGTEAIPLTVREGQLNRVISNDKIVLLIENDVIHIENLSIGDPGCRIRLHGYGQAELLIRQVDGQPVTAVAFEGHPLDLASRNGWTSVTVTFNTQTVGELTVAD